MKPSKYILNARNTLKLRQVDMARLLGVRQVNLCKWEQEYTMPPGDVIMKVMKLMNSRKRGRQ